ncbi:MAG: hypothetical protein NTZ49_02100 [Candidatus Parcubacteria bacterium]|nr:hypothetical protein [Candidatus Parcubacteria bacterium]
MKTMVTTKTVTNTQLAIATAVLLGVSALSFIILPALTNTSSTVPNYYRYASWVCQDGSAATQGSDNTCNSYTNWYNIALSSCAGHCNYMNVCGLKSFLVIIQCSNTPCIGPNESLYGTLKCCAGLVPVNGICRVSAPCVTKGQPVYGTLKCCTGLVIKNGICQQANCIDSDGGKNYYTRGTVRNLAGSILATDKCSRKDFLGRVYFVLSGKYITEYFCSGSSLDKTLYLCPKGCYNGACIK